jgi:D-lactate dehydrogenase (cytochrome)
MGGTVSGEHGVGVGKVAHIAEEHGPVHMDLMRKLKRTLDPDNIMNPGKMLTLDSYGYSFPHMGHH